MRNHRRYHHQQRRRLWQSLASLQCFIIFKALLLYTQVATADGDGPTSCGSSALNPMSCPAFEDMSLFPFLASQACGAASSLVLTGCDAVNKSKPTWPRFVDPTEPGIGALGPPVVMDFYNPFPPSSLKRQPNDSSAYFNSSADPMGGGVGLINLTWSSSTDLLHQNACESQASVSEITHYLPEAIDLTSLAHSSFQLTPSNIILLFNCNSSASSKLYLQKNSTACSSYVKDCRLQKKEISSCYQLYPPASKELKLQHAMNSSNCETAMFFVKPENSTLASQWRPGLIQLNWTTNGTSWMASSLTLCEGCLQTHGTCGYNDTDIFQCYCTSNQISATNCTFAHPGGKSSGKKKLVRIVVMIAIGAAGFAIALSLSLTAFCIWKRKVFVRTNIPSGSLHMKNKAWMKKLSFLGRKQDPILAKEMSYQEIVHATEAFADKHMLGDGGFGAVFKGVLADGRKVAVKRLYHDNYRRMEHFFNEIKVLSNLNHPNLVKLYGFCCEDEKDLLLVFEYAPQGTVSDQLHNTSNPPMSWKLRLNIACETAEALSYLHNSVVPPIYHRDVKTTNILLDEGFHAKLADFGLSKLVPLKATHVSTAPQGTPGYLDPDYHQCYQLTDKSDVYSLGVVLMELVSAKLAVDMSRGRGEINLSTLAVIKIQCGQLEELVDPSLQMNENQCIERSIKRVVELAFECLHAEKDLRPSMSAVAETLIKIRREYVDSDAEPLVNLHINTQSAPTACESSALLSGSGKPLQYPQDSPCSAFFSSGSSSNLSSS